MNSIPVEPRITEYLYRKAAHRGIPLSGTFELTPVCNMDCKMCYVRMSRQQQEAIRPLRTASQWLALAEQARQAGMLYLLLTGGEPFLHPEFQKIMNGLHQMGFLISINSNATLINEETVAWLRQCPPVRINITLYGTSDETYANLCGNPQGFTQVTHAITLLQQANIPIKLNCSLTPHNISDLPGIASFAREHQLPLQIAAYMFPPVRKDPSLIGTNDRFSPQQAAQHTAYGEYLTLGKERFLAAGANLTLPSDTEETCAEVGEGIRCRAGKCSFWITWEGYMTPCGMFPCDKKVNVFDTDFTAAWAAVKEFAAGICLPAKCAGCSMKKTCRACAAMVYAESGDFSKVPQYRCEMTKAYPDAYTRLAEQIK